MYTNNIKAPYECMEPKEYKLFDFVPEFSEFRQFDDLSRFGCENIADNLIRLEKKGKIHFENKECTKHLMRKLLCTILLSILHPVPDREQNTGKKLKTI